MVLLSIVFILNIYVSDNTQRAVSEWKQVDNSPYVSFLHQMNTEQSMNKVKDLIKWVDIDKFIMFYFPTDIANLKYRRRLSNHFYHYLPIFCSIWLTSPTFFYLYEWRVDLSDGFLPCMWKLLLGPNNSTLEFGSKMRRFALLSPQMMHFHSSCLVSEKLKLVPAL